MTRTISTTRCLACKRPAFSPKDAVYGGTDPVVRGRDTEEELLESVPGFKSRLNFFLETRPELTQLVSRYHQRGENDRHLLSLARAFRMKKILTRRLDEAEFLSDYGIRALSRYHLKHPFEFEYHGSRYEVKYVAGESRTQYSVATQTGAGRFGCLSTT